MLGLRKKKPTAETMFSLISLQQSYTERVSEFSTYCCRTLYKLKQFKTSFCLRPYTIHFDPISADFMLPSFATSASIDCILIFCVVIFPFVDCT